MFALQPSKLFVYVVLAALRIGFCNANEYCGRCASCDTCPAGKYADHKGSSCAYADWVCPWKLDPTLFRPWDNYRHLEIDEKCTESYWRSINDPTASCTEPSNYITCDACKNCPAGWVPQWFTNWNQYKRLDCAYCPKGWYSREGWDQCEECPANTVPDYTNAENKAMIEYKETAAHQCICPEEYHWNIEIKFQTVNIGGTEHHIFTPTRTCEKCPEGKFSFQENAESCGDTCPQGKFTKKIVNDGADTHKCILCPSGWYADASNQMECKQCEHTFHVVGDTSNPTSCSYPCNYGLYKKYGEDTVCKQCPLGFTSPGPYDEYEAKECNPCFSEDVPFLYTSDPRSMQGRYCLFDCGRGYVIEALDRYVLQSQCKRCPQGKALKNDVTSGTHISECLDSTAYCMYLDPLNPNECVECLSGTFLLKGLESTTTCVSECPAEYIGYEGQCLKDCGRGFVVRAIDTSPYSTCEMCPYGKALKNDVTRGVHKSECLDSTAYCMYVDPLNTNECVECLPRYHLGDDKQCHKNVCTCTNGQPTTHYAEPGCTEHNTEMCQYCNYGPYAFNAKTKTCDETDYDCYCENGVAETGVECPGDGRSGCGSCNDGYELKSLAWFNDHSAEYRCAPCSEGNLKHCECNEGERKRALSDIQRDFFPNVPEDDYAGSFKEFVSSVMGNRCPLKTGGMCTGIVGRLKRLGWDSDQEMSPYVPSFGTNMLWFFYSSDHEGVVVLSVDYKGKELKEIRFPDTKDVTTISQAQYDNKNGDYSYGLYGDFYVEDITLDVCFSDACAAHQSPSITIPNTCGESASLQDSCADGKICASVLGSFVHEGAKTAPRLQEQHPLRLGNELLFYKVAYTEPDQQNNAGTPKGMQIITTDFNLEPKRVAWIPADKFSLNPTLLIEHVFTSMLNEAAPEQWGSSTFEESNKAHFKQAKIVHIRQIQEPCYEVECADNTCVCPDGEAAVGEACVSSGAHICTSCNVQGKVVHRPGVNVEIYGVSSDDSNVAKCGVQCPEGEHVVIYSDGDSRCFENRCNCEDGYDAKGTLCPVHGSNACESCYEYTYNPVSKIPISDTENKCLPACPAGHSRRDALQPEECVPNVCWCSHGTGSTGTDCPSHNEYKCESCDDTFTLTDKFSCKCTEQDQVISGNRCIDVECPVGWHRRANSKVLIGACEKNECECENGVPATSWVFKISSGLCYTYPDENDNVNAYTAHTNEMCKLLSNLDANIQAAPDDQFVQSSTDNPVDCWVDQEQLVYINKKYIGDAPVVCSEDQQCLCNPFGDALTESSTLDSLGPQCPVHNGVMCRSCNDGFHLTADHRCAANVCECENGGIAAGTLCNEHGAKICTQCNANYYLDALTATCVACPANSHQTEDDYTGSFCACNTGYLRSGDECVAFECAEGFHLDATTNKCAANECTCPGGVQAVSSVLTIDSGNCNVYGEEHVVSDSDTCSQLVALYPSSKVWKGDIENTVQPSGCVSFTGWFSGFSFFNPLSTETLCSAGTHCLCNPSTATLNDALRPQCAEHNSVQCVSCNAGYTLSNNQCVDSPCSCTQEQLVARLTGCNHDCSNREECCLCEDGLQLIQLIQEYSQRC